MNTAATKKFWRYLFWLGPAIVVVGLTAGFVAGSWQPVPLGLVIAGIVTTGLWLLFQARESNWWGRRSTQVGTNALVATLSVLVILGLVNFLGTRHPVRIDFTEAQLFTLAPQTRQLVQNLPPVKVWVFDRNQNPQDRELLENYQRLGQNFSFEYVDPQAQPGLEQKFGVKKFGEVYLEAGRRKQLLQTVNDQQRLSEIRLTNGLQQITSTRTAKVYFLQGHGEHPLSSGEGAISQALGALGQKNYSTQPLNLTQQPAIPQDASVVVVAGPKRKLFDQEVKALSNYLNQGGSLLLMIDPSTDPGLDSLLKDWGVILDNRLAIDPSGGSVGLGPAVPLVTNYGPHPITKDFGNGISFYRGARPIETTPVAGVQVTPLLLTSPQSWAESDLESQELQFDPQSDRQGPLALGVALSRKVIPSNSKQSEIKATASPQASPTPSPSTPPQAKSSSSPQASSTPQAKTTPSSKASPTPSPSNSPTPQASPTPSSSNSPTPQASPTSSPTTPAKAEPGKKPAESRLVVLGNSDFATNGVFEQQLNGDVFLNSVSWLSKQDQQLLSIRPKEAKNRRINMTSQQASLLGWTSLLVMPLIGFGTAGIIWWRRR